jgi:hypothetical protein
MFSHDVNSINNEDMHWSLTARYETFDQTEHCFSLKRNNNEIKYSLHNKMDTDCLIINFVEKWHKNLIIFLPGKNNISENWLELCTYT